MNDPHIAVSPVSSNNGWGRWFPGPQSTPFSDGLREIASRHGLTLQAIRSADRRRACVRARWECFAFLRARRWSLIKIGDYFGQDHTTVMNGLRRHAELSAAP